MACVSRTHPLKPLVEKLRNFSDMYHQTKTVTDKLREIFKLFAASQNGYNGGDTNIMQLLKDTAIE